MGGPPLRNFPHIFPFISTAKKAKFLVALIAIYLSLNIYLSWNLETKSDFKLETLQTKGEKNKDQKATELSGQFGSPAMFLQNILTVHPQEVWAAPRRLCLQKAELASPDRGIGEGGRGSASVTRVGLFFFLQPEPPGCNCLLTHQHLHKQHLHHKQQGRATTTAASEVQLPADCWKVVA